MRFLRLGALGAFFAAVAVLATAAIGVPSTAEDPAVLPTPSGLVSTIGTARTPQVVRIGSSLREVDPSNPLVLLQSPFRFAGVDAYELNTWWGINAGCGSMESAANLDTLFSSLGPGAVVRVWFFQQFAVDAKTQALNWEALDRTVDTANAYGVHLIATLGNEDGTCDDNVWKSPSWYSSGYKVRTPGLPVSYARWVSAVVSRYKDNPAILAWEPINEPRADTCNVAVAETGPNCWSYRSCPSETAARDALRSFFDQIGTMIRSEDSNHLISDGAPPIGGCGTIDYDDWFYVESSPAIDLMSFHDYSGTAPAASTTLDEFAMASAALRKPYFAGENGGVNVSGAGGPSTACPSGTRRAAGYRAKLEQEFASSQSFVGWLFWDWGPGDPTTSAAPCNYSTWPGDAMMGMLAQVNGLLR